MRLSAAAIAVGATLALPHCAAAAVTVGSPLTTAPQAAGCGGSTDTNVAISGGTVAVPFDGVVVRWRMSLQTGGGSNPYSVRVLRPAGASYTGVGTGPPQTAPATGINTLTLASPLPVHAGDIIGVDCPNGAPAPFSNAAQGGAATTYAYFSPPLADGSTAIPSNQIPGEETLVNADIVGYPTVSSVAPASGPSAGGTTVTITGVHLADATAVTFGGAAATAVHVVSDSQLTATAPAHAAGPIDVRVVNAAGTSPTVAGDTFSYQPPPTPPVPPTPPRPTVGIASLKSSTARVSANGRGHFTLTCTATGPCRGTYEIDATGAQATRKHKTKRPKAVVLARGSYSLAAGASTNISFRLTASGRKLLRRHHGRLRTTLKLTQTGGHPAAAPLSLKAA